MQAFTTIGLDIAKSVFQIHEVDAAGHVIVRRQLKRRYVLPFFQKLAPCLVGIEACASSHHWSRELQALGHTVRLMLPAYVKPYVIIPIVFETAADPVRLGLVGSLRRPGGNITGVTQASDEMAPKRLELLHELLPKRGVLALLVNPAAPELAEPQKREVVSAARALSIDLQVLNASTEQDFERVFAKLSELRAGGLVIGGDALFTSHAKQLAA